MSKNKLHQPIFAAKAEFFATNSQIILGGGPTGDSNKVTITCNTPAENIGLQIPALSSSDIFTFNEAAQTLKNKQVEIVENTFKINGTTVTSIISGVADTLQLGNSISTHYVTIWGDDQGITFSGAGNHEISAGTGTLILGTHEIIGNLIVQDSLRIASSETAGDYFSIAAFNPTPETYADFIRFTVGDPPVLRISSAAGGTVNIQTTDLVVETFVKFAGDGYIRPIDETDSRRYYLSAYDLTNNQVRNLIEVTNGTVPYVYIGPDGSNGEVYIDVNELTVMGDGNGLYFSGSGLHQIQADEGSTLRLHKGELHLCTFLDEVMSDILLANGKAISGDNGTGSTWMLSVFDSDGGDGSGVYAPFMIATTDATPSVVLQEPITGTLSITATTSYAKGKFGYNGGGASVTQGTNITTDVTLNNICGRVITVNGTINAGSQVAFVVYTDKLEAGDIILHNGMASTNDGQFSYRIAKDNAGYVNYFRIYIKNNHPSSNLTATHTIDFMIVKSIYS